MTKEEASQRIQELLAEVKALADEHKVEFSFAGATMHYYLGCDDRRKHPAKFGLLVSDDEWESSNCYGPVQDWEESAFEPEVYEDM